MTKKKANEKPRVYTKKLSDFQTDPDNANLHTQRGRGLVQQSQQKRGFARPGFATKDGVILGGNLSILDVGAEVFGPDVDVIVVETDGKQPIVHVRTDLEAGSPEAVSLALEDNRTAEASLEWDIDVLQRIHEFDNDVDLTELWMENELKQIGVQLEEPPEAPEPQIDRAEELREKWGVESGQLWRMGEHRLICGDCTDAAVVERVMGGKKAQMCFTSPPYNAGKTATEAKTGKSSKYDSDLDNRSNDEYFGLLINFTDLALDHAEYVFVNIQLLANNKNSFIDYQIEYRKKLCDIAIWDKKTAQPAMAARVMDSRFEFILIFGGNSSRAIGTREFRGMVHNVYDGNPQRHNENADLRAATFPVDLPEYFISNFTNKNELIYEPFSGSGTTLIACERLNRKCRAVEISPAYCAVTLQRYFDMTGDMPELIEK